MNWNVFIILAIEVNIQRAKNQKLFQVGELSIAERLQGS